MKEQLKKLVAPGVAAVGALMRISADGDDDFAALGLGLALVGMVVCCLAVHRANALASRCQGERAARSARYYR